MPWSNRLFGDCAELIRDTINPGEIVEPIYIGLEHISQGGLTLLGVGKSSDVVSQKSRFRKGDILFGKLRPYFRKAVIAPFDGVCSTDIWVVRAKNGIDQGFLFYWMVSKEFIKKSSQASEGTKMPRAKWDFVEKFEKSIPPLPEQRAIADVLSALDDKIELNNQINATLEQLAWAIFKHMFIENLQNVEWDEKPIGDIVTIVGGSTPSTSNKEYWEGGSIHWATPKDLASLQSPILLDTNNVITELGLKQISSGLLPIGSVLLSSRAPIGYMAMTQIPTAINQGFIGITCTENMPNYYIINWLKANLEEIIGRANGTTFLEISKTNFRPMLVKIPPAEVKRAFVTTIDPIYKKITTNLIESSTLAELRDTLLPKLMSGQVRVNLKVIARPLLPKQSPSTFEE